LVQLTEASELWLETASAAADDAENLTSFSYENHNNKNYSKNLD
jgi:hypothetical protein